MKEKLKEYLPNFWALVSRTFGAYRRILDYSTYSLLFTTWLMTESFHGDIFFNFYNSLRPGVMASIFLRTSRNRFLFFFIANLLMIYFIAWTNRQTKIFFGAEKRSIASKTSLILLSSVIISLIFISYTSLFFSTGGGWLIGGRAGISGGLSNFWVDLIGYAILVFFAKMLLAAKAKLDRYFNTSIVLFLGTLFFLWSDLHFIFFVVR